MIIEGETGTQRLLGYVLEIAGDRAKCRLMLTEDHTNRHSALHGGIAAAVLDNAMGATGSLTVDETGKAPFLTVSMTINYHAPARVGDLLEAEGWVTGGGRSLVFIGGELRAGDRLIATASGVFKRVKT
ncbi:PaaI family thioesterase [Jannaschia formosa]|uniref:PaaI family thioesterase n=1 Tax=Jannaschia formosa TaxID=2259592 RepID=UPI000E1BB847|nr:PaaI family thioesterase [Jannaschia formosa]TFL18056.1 PaaI family thioesterase [Jannaschia formosa]